MRTDPPPARLSFGQLLKRFRLGAGLSQAALAEQAGVSWRTISDLERGVKRGPRPSTLRLLADALALGVEERATLQARAYPPDEPSRPAVLKPAPAAVPTNLPLALTCFVGRRRELALVRRLLDDASLVTLTGAGGCGKTRLALEVARTLVNEAPASLGAGGHADGIWLVELAALNDGALVPGAVAAVLGLRERPGEALLESLTTFLRARRVLLVLDNCEHLIVACAQLVDALLRVCPQLTILATSREPLGITGEQSCAVPSLSLPEPQPSMAPDQALEFEAVDLFVQRAQAVSPEFTLTTQNCELVAQVCRRLDGIPLALELAAARLAALPLESLGARLDDRFRLLTGGSRTALPRQQTLRATLEWSHDLLSEPERILLRRLSVFAAGWTLESAEFVCAGDGIAAEEVPGLLAGLATKSLVLLEEGRAGPRYRLLEMMREYGRANLQAAGDVPRLADRHLDCYVALANQAALRIGGVEREQWLERLEAELENLRAALNWSSLEEDRQEVGLRLAAALEDFWYVRGYAGEGRRWLERLMQHGSPAVPAALRARALEVLALLIYYQGDYEQAMPLFQAVYALHSSEGNVASATWALNYQGMLAIRLGAYQQAMTLLERVLPAHREQGDRHGVAWALSYLATIRGLHGDLSQAAALHEESLVVFEELGDTFGVGHQRANLANVARDQGEYRQATRLYRESLRARRALKDKTGLADCFEGLATLAAAEGQPARAARLFGAADHLRMVIATPVDPIGRSAHERVIADLGALLGEAPFAAAWAEGRTMPLEAAIALALKKEAPADPGRQRG